MPFLWNCWSHGSLGSLHSLKQLSPGFSGAQQDSEEKQVSWGLLCPQLTGPESCSPEQVKELCPQLTGPESCSPEQVKELCPQLTGPESHRSFTCSGLQDSGP